MIKSLKKAIIVILAFFTAAACITAISITKAKAAGTTVENCGYGLLNGAAVRIPNVAEDDPGYGLRYTVAMDAEEYNDLNALNIGVRYGLLITTLENHKKVPLTEDSVFNNGEYEPNSTVTSKLRVAQVERETLAEYKGTEDAELIGKRYFNVSMTNIEGNKSTQFIAVAYIKYNDADGISCYRFIDSTIENNARSMAYVAQLALENEQDIAKIGEENVELFKNTYINGVTKDVGVELNFSYDGENSTKETKNIKLELGKITEESVKATLESENLIDAERYDAPVIVNPESADYVINVYANTAVQSIKVNLNVKEAVEDVYADCYGYFMTDGNADLEFTARKEVLIKKDSGEVAGTYKVYKDGVVVLKTNGETYLGTLENGTLTITIGNVAYVYDEQLELSSAVYNSIAGMYYYEGKTIALKADGSAVYDGASVKYLLAYDEVGERLAIIIIAESPVIKQINKVNGEFVIDGLNKAGSKAQYEALAGTYLCTAGAIADEYVTFNANGTITKVVDGRNAQIGTFVLSPDETVNGTINGGSGAVAITGTFAISEGTKQLTFTGENSFAFSCKTLTGDSIYNIMASEEGEIYSGGYSITLYTAPSDDADRAAAGWYKAVGFEGKNVSYKLSPITDTFGILKIIYKGTTEIGEDCTLYYGIANGIRWIDPENLSKVGLWEGYISFKVESAYSSQRETFKAIAKAKIADYEANVDNGYVGVTEETKSLYEKIAGTYSSRNDYTGNSLSWGIGFKLESEKYTDGEYAGKYKASYTVVPGVGYYELEPITNNFGVIRIYTNYAGTFYSSGKTGYTEGWYSEINGEYVLRVHYGPQDGRYWHPFDVTKKGSTFTTWEIFDELAGNAKTEGKATSKTYTDASGATLKLENTGSMTNNGAGFELTLADSLVVGSYDFIAIGNDYGKILMHFGVKEDGANLGYIPAQVGNPDYYLIGEYKKIGGKWLISFENKYGKFVFSEDGLDSVKTELSGAYSGISENVAIEKSGITSITAENVSKGTFTVGSTVYNYSISDGRTIITARISGKDVIYVK